MFKPILRSAKTILIACTTCLVLLWLYNQIYLGDTRYSSYGTRISGSGDSVGSGGVGGAGGPGGSVGSGGLGGSGHRGSGERYDRLAVEEAALSSIPRGESRGEGVEEDMGEDMEQGTVQGMGKGMGRGKTKQKPQHVIWDIPIVEPNIGGDTPGDTEKGKWQSDKGGSKGAKGRTTGEKLGTGGTEEERKKNSFGRPLAGSYGRPVKGEYARQPRPSPQGQKNGDETGSQEAGEEVLARSNDQTQLEAVREAGMAGEVPASEVTGKNIAFVVAKTSKEDTRWIDRHLSDWNVSIYEVDNPEAEFTVPVNKGREAMVYLTYIIDNYPHLPPLTLFHHSQRFQWHTDNPSYDSLPLLHTLRIPNLLSSGYTNLRCSWTPGCPSEIYPIKDYDPNFIPNPNLDNDDSPDAEEPEEQFDEYGNPVEEDEDLPEVSAKESFLPAFRVLFPTLEIPDVIAVPCCSQFALSRAAILSNPLSEYVHWRQWLMDTPLPDAISGRVFEYSWHIMFGKPAVYCPDARECYCGVYGMKCDTVPGVAGVGGKKGKKGGDGEDDEDCSEWGCDSVYQLPPWGDMPNGWPHLGWDGEDRGWVGTLP